MRRRNTYYLYILLLTGTCFHLSCKRQLDLEPKSAYPEGIVFGNIANATGAVLSVYEALPAARYNSTIPINYPYDTDEALGVVGSSDNNTADLSRYNVQPTNVVLAPVFDGLYTGIERANICIKNIPAMTLYKSGSATEQQQLQRLYGEALTLRAQCFFELVRNWGDVPAPFKPSIDQETLFLPKSDRDSIYIRILDDLKTAEDLVPWRNEGGIASDERLTKGAVKGLRARFALYMGGYSLRKASNTMERPADYLKYYQITRDECDSLLQRRDKHTLNPDFKAVFKDGIDAYKIDPYGEVMFEIAMARDVDSRLGYNDGPRYSIAGSSALLGSGTVRMLPTYFYAFDSLDVRRDVTIAPYRTDLGTGIRTAQNILTLTSGKFRVDWITPVVTTASSYTGLNWPVLRYADILLMFAEVENELNGGPTAAAISAYEEVRKRGFKGNEDKIGTPPATKAAFFNAIVNERSYEFGGEGLRKYDLIRWNMLDQKITAARDNLTKMLTKVSPYNTLPQAMYYKNNATDVIWGNSLYSPEPAAAPAGYTKVAWVSSLTAAYIKTVASSFTANHSELYPLPQTAIQSNPALTQDYGY